MLTDQLPPQHRLTCSTPSPLERGRPQTSTNRLRWIQIWPELWIKWHLYNFGRAIFNFCSSTFNIKIPLGHFCSACCEYQTWHETVIVSVSCLRVFASWVQRSTADSTTCKWARSLLGVKVAVLRSQMHPSGGEIVKWWDSFKVNASQGPVLLQRFGPRFLRLGPWRIEAR